jgi:hypothetical protein
MLKFIKRVLGKLGLYPYPFYVFKYNKPFKQIRLLLNKPEAIIIDAGANAGISIENLR